MKRAIGVLLTALVIAPGAMAQTTTIDRNPGVTIKGGFSYGNVSNGGLLPGGAKQRNGAALGVGLHTGGVVGFGIEGLYAERGVIGSSPGTSRELDYIDLPLYVRLAAVNRAVEPFAYAGPQISWEIKCDADGGTCPSGRRKTTYAGVIGGGVRLSEVGGLSIEGRYIYGLTDLRLGTVTDSDSYRTRSFMILLGFGR